MALLLTTKLRTNLSKFIWPLLESNTFFADQITLLKMANEISQIIAAHHFASLEVNYIIFNTIVLEIP